MNDTIAAIATSSGVGSIGIIRISGKKSFEIISKVFIAKDKKFNIVANSIKYGHIVYEDEEIDEVLVSFFKAPNSFTTEDICEINCHGGTAVLNKILGIVLKAGARLAEPGEFTKRAFLNGRIDLAQAEAVIDIINSKTDRMLQESEKQLKGVFSNKLKSIEKKLLDVISDIEANIDYPEYDIEQVTYSKIETVISEINNELVNIGKTFNSGKIIREGINIALIGKPNVGKSSILNMLLREERAIVTDIAGTTRDTIQETISIKGVPVNIIDTAGIRDTEDVVEKIGVDKAKDQLKKADIIIYIIDCTQDLDDTDIEYIKTIDKKRLIVLINKIDLSDSLNIEDIKTIIDAEIIETSTITELGLDKLEKSIFEKCNIDSNIKDNEIILTNARHKQIIDNCIDKNNKILIDTSNGMPLDIISINIIEMLKTIGEITGETVSENIINTIFSKFCLGK